MSFLVVDLEWGGLDGWYSDRENAERIAEHVKQKLGHNRVIVVEHKDNGEPRRIGWAFIADRTRQIKIDPIGLLPIVNRMKDCTDEEIRREVAKLVCEQDAIDQAAKRAKARQ